MAKCRFIVDLDLPPGVSQTSMCHFIKTAVVSEPGYWPPEEPFHHLKRESVEVKSFARVMRSMRSKILRSGVNGVLANDGG